MSDSMLVITGSIGRDPELRFTNSGRAICSFTVAVSRRFKKDETWVEETTWHDVTVWGEMGENIAASCAKGTRVMCSGYVKQEEWDDKETGKKRSKHVLVADEVGVSLRWATAVVDKVERERS